ncbi:hypothetical protein CGRA01v4_03499 [Colletotrichum graminicola]|nr:hypothetical protein CGRA01v4_03499 [Colletotrichum graminicola]
MRRHCHESCRTNLVQPIAAQNHTSIPPSLPTSLLTQGTVGGWIANPPPSVLPAYLVRAVVRCQMTSVWLLPSGFVACILLHLVASLNLEAWWCGWITSNTARPTGAYRNFPIGTRGNNGEACLHWIGSQASPRSQKP